jgi:hypothetical protein
MQKQIHYSNLRNPLGTPYSTSSSIRNMQFLMPQHSGPVLFEI